MGGGRPSSADWAVRSPAGALGDRRMVSTVSAPAERVRVAWGFAPAELGPSAVVSSRPTGAGSKSETDSGGTNPTVASRTAGAGSAARGEAGPAGAGGSPV